jgi:hypothetical protein
MDEKLDPNASTPASEEGMKSVAMIVCSCLGGRNRTPRYCSSETRRTMIRTTSSLQTKQSSWPDGGFRSAREKYFKHRARPSESD